MAVSDGNLTATNTENIALDGATSNPTRPAQEAPCGGVSAAGGQGTAAESPRGRGHEAEPASPNTTQSRSGELDTQHAENETSRTQGGIKKNTRAHMTIASLNMKGRGVQSAYAPQNKWGQINRYLRDEKIGVIALQETHMSAEFAAGLDEIYGRNLHIIHSFDPERTNSRGVAIVINKKQANFKEVTHHTIIQGRALSVTIPWHRSKKVTLLAVYAPNGTAENEGFWREIQAVYDTGRVPKPDILLGDFNLVEDAVDRYPTHGDDGRAIAALQGLRQALRLTDGWRRANPTEAGYTFPKSGSGSMSRIDRIYATPDKIQTCNSWKIDRTCPVDTDHHAVTVELTDPQTPYIGKGRWTIPLATLEDAEFSKSLQALTEDLESEISRVARHRSNEENPQKALARFKSRVKQLARNRARETIPKAKLTLLRLEQELVGILKPREGEISEEQRAKARMTQLKIDKLQKKRLEGRRIYARATHHVEGDTASKYWTGLTKEQKPRDIMYALYSPNELRERKKKTDEMATLARDYHDQTQLRDYTPMDERRQEMTQDVLRNVEARHPETDPGSMGSLIQRHEVEAALNNSANGKASGMDGIPYELWKKLQREHEKGERTAPARPDILQILTAVYNDVEKNGVDPEAQFSIGWMCPIYKKGDSDNIANYRPITLLNTDYKIMTKTLAMRLVTAVPNLIHKNQAGFIPGRSIFDQTQLAHLMINYAEATEENGVIVALDQEKAYDRIDHEYIWATLRKFDLPTHLIDTIQALYEHAETSVVINGVISAPFRVTRGVRQGDPMSCLIFDLAIEPLACMIRKSDLRGFRIPGEVERLITTLFADDTTVYLAENDDYADLERILCKWCDASLAKFNLDKTQILPIGTEAFRKEYQRNGAPIQHRNKVVPDGKAVRVLGAWIGNNTDEATIWSPRIDAVKRSLDKWKACRPTLTGKALIIQMVVGGGTQYMTKVQGMPAEIERAFIKLTTTFIWGEGKRAGIKYDTLCRPKEQGGIGLLDLKARNKSIALTWIKQFADISGGRPTWCAVMDVLIGGLATKASGKVQNLSRFHILLQTWDTNTTPRAGLPTGVRGMLRTAKEMKVTFAAVKPTRALRKQLPMWYHFGAGSELRRLNNHYYSNCLRTTHQLTTTMDALRVTRRARNRVETGHADKPDCGCVDCEADRRRGCKKPNACCNLAMALVRTLPKIWDPLEATPHDGLSLSLNDRQIHSRRLQENEPFLFNPALSSADDISAGFRAFYDVDDPPKYPAKRHPRTSASVPRETEHAYIGTATAGEHTRDAKAGAAVVFKRAAGRAAKVPQILPQTRLAAEALGIIMAVLNTPGDAPLHIHTTATQITHGMNVRLTGWEDRDWTGIRDKMILRSAAYHLRRRSAPTTWHLDGNKLAAREYEGAEAEAELCLHEQQFADIDLTIPGQYLQSGIKLTALTQRLAYQKITSLEATSPYGQRTSDNLYQALLAIDQINGSRPTDAQIWAAIWTKPIPRTVADFLWKTMHGAIKCGDFWKHVPDLANRAICPTCGVIESPQHILMDCSATGCQTAWGQAKAIWERTRKPWPAVNFGAVLGVGLLAPDDTTPGERRLLKIVITETVWTIWRLRCERIVGHQDEPGWQHDELEVVNKWRSAMNNRLITDRISTNELRFRRKATPRELVKETWKSVSNMAEAADEDWFKSRGVLVGRGRGDPG